MTVLLGITTAGTNADFVGNGDPTAFKFTALASGTLATIFAQFKVANPTLTSVELGIYADDAANARPGALLTSATTSAVAIQGTGSFSVNVAGAAISVTNGTIYWLAWRGVGEAVNFQGDSVANAYLEHGGSNPLSNPFESSGNFAGNVRAVIWGEDSGAAPSTTTAAVVNATVIAVQRSVTF